MSPIVLAITLAAQGWVQHKDPLGFQVQHPPGWSVETREGNLILIHSADKSATVAVQPFFLRQPAAARQWIQQTPALLAAVFPQARIERSEQRRQRPDEAVASLSYGAGGRASLLCSIDGRSGMLYAIAAPQAQFAARKPELVRILQSFSFTAGPGADYVRWQDPRENAFSIEVPRQWNVTGGSFRYASVDVRTAVVLNSPDGQVRVTAGDQQIPPFTLPNQMLAMAGFREGGWYSPGYGVNMMVRRYLTGAQFAAEYVRTRGCAGVAVTESRDRPDVAQALNRIYAQLGGIVNQQLTAGEVAFTCTANGQPMRGYYFAGTLLTTTMGSGLWNVQFLHGYLAAAGKTALAQTVLNHLLATIQLNPQWVGMQQNITSQTSAIVSRTHNEISNMISETYWSRQRSRDESMRHWSNMMLGQADVRDPDTGETWKVASGHNYYWRKGDTIVGTNTYTKPDIDFTPLKEY